MGTVKLKSKRKRISQAKKKPTQQQIYNQSSTLGKSVNYLKKTTNKQGQQARLHNKPDRCHNILGKWQISFCQIVVSLAHIPMNHQPRGVPSAVSFTLV